MVVKAVVGIAFLLSGAAGLTYEVLWSRYLGLFVGHSAYAQVLVLAVYLGGMAVGALSIGGRLDRLESPLRWYAGAEIVLAVFGLGFHALFVAATDLSYGVLFPAIGSASWVGSLRWAVAGALILPQAVVLGTTFPLMAAGLVRDDRSHPGERVALAYLLNTLGGAVGVLLAGFWMIGHLGLPGTSIAAAMMNLAAATLVLVCVRRSGAHSVIEAEEPAHSTGSSPSLAPSEAALLRVVLVVAFLTAVASFAYEIGWIRMLSLVLGSATHAFELMLSAFIFGIALGAWWIRRRADSTRDPVKLLGLIQIVMGLTALLSLPVYLSSFGVMATLMETLPGRDGGYTMFNIARYGLCLLVMLPSTIMAGATLPVMTGMLLRGGSGERAIGRVYGSNTIGSVVGAAAAGLLGLPLLGLKGLIMAGAALDVVLGLWLLERSARWRGVSPRFALVALPVSAAAFAAVAAVAVFNPNTITSGVYRHGALPDDDRWRSLYYADGRTATVSAHVGTSDGVIVLATNGKPDASLGPRWILEGRDTLPIRPIAEGRDYTTQVLAPILGLAHHPEARSIANIGHGSGMTAAAFLTSPGVERVVTIEIEPLMVEASFVFLPANAPAFTDPRVSYVFDDAKSYFAYRQERFDVIFAEPSNPWVSGTASLFSREFYERVTDFMADDGVLVEWMQLYEVTDDLFLSVLAALDPVFPYYRAYLTGDSDVAIVASRQPLRAADWSVLESDGFRALTSSAPPFQAQHLEAAVMFDQDTFRSLLDAGVDANSDYHPVLDLGAERSRFEQSAAAGIYSFAVSRVDLAAHIAGRTIVRTAHQRVPAYGLGPTVLRERGAWLRTAVEEGGGIAPEDFPEWQEELVHLQTFLLLTSAEGQLGSWETWASGFMRAENALHWGTTGWLDPIFYRNVDAFLERADAPPAARATVELMRAYGLGDWEGTAVAADQLVTRVGTGERWVPADVLLDVAAIAYIEVGRPDAALRTIATLAPRAGRSDDHARVRLLRAIAEAGR